MNIRKRPVVQLTPLLDLLFIMIFIGLLTPYAEPPGSTENVPKLKKMVSEQQKEIKKMKDRLEVAGSLSKTTNKNAESGQYRNLFTANLYYRDSSGKYPYKETKIFFANNETGIYSYRLNMTDSGVIEGRKNPLTIKEVDHFKKCKSVTISHNQIAEECAYGPGWNNKLNCKRTSDMEYLCKLHQQRTNEHGAEKTYAWDYKMKLIKVDEPELQ